MGYVDHGRAQLLVKCCNLYPHLHPEFGVKVRQGFIEQEDSRVADNRPSDGDALSLSARKLPWFSLQQGFNLQNLRRRGDLGLDFGLGCPQVRRPNARFS
jgi:hypothetical protein